MNVKETELGSELWDDFRGILANLKDNEIDRDTYWALIDLVDNYGKAMELKGLLVDEDEVSSRLIQLRRVLKSI